MTQPIRFLFDENLLAGPEVRQQLSGSLKLSGASAEIVYFYDKFPLGAQDRDWIPAIASEGGWIVVTCDRGKKSKKDDKLPEICAAFGVTHVMLSRSIAKQNWYHKSIAIMANWSGLIAAASAPAGTGYLLCPAGEKSSTIRKISDPPAIETPPSQQSLFDSSQPPEDGPRLAAGT